MPFEVEIIEGLQSIRSDFFDGFFVAYAYLASVFAIAAVFLFIFFVYDKKTGLAYLITTGFAIFSMWLIKKIVQRPRPFVSNVSIVNIGKETGFSMPSGHLTCAIVIAIFLMYIAFRTFKKKGKIVCSIFIPLYVVLMVVDRMYLGVHYLTDTLAGIGLGACWCGLALVALPPLGRLLDKWIDRIKQKRMEKKTTPRTKPLKVREDSDEGVVDEHQDAVVEDKMAKHTDDDDGENGGERTR